VMLYAPQFEKPNAKEIKLLNIKSKSKQNSLKSRKSPFNDTSHSRKSYASFVLVRFRYFCDLLLHSTMTQLLFSSHNAHKINEIRSMLPSSIRLLSLADCGFADEIPETGQTLRDNAILKARYAAERMN